jgi:hypothetical protein
MRSYHLVCAVTLIGGAALSGCVAHAQAGGYAEADAPVVFVDTPTLVEVDADVWVVRDYDYAVYYTDGYYWVYKNDVWWRSRAYDRGWARAEVNVVPVVIVKRDHHAYVRFHGQPGAKTRPGPREQLASEAAGNPHGGPPGHDEIPGVGNQRKAEDGHPGLGNEKKEEKREEKAERREEKREEKAEKKEEKKEEKKDDKKGGPKKK